jgi:hypothetical protein
MMEAYQLIDDSHFEKLKEIITDAVNEQTDIGLKYYLYPKYKKQFDIIEEVLFQRDRELVKTPDLDEEFCK